VNGRVKGKSGLGDREAENCPLPVTDASSAVGAWKLPSAFGDAFVDQPVASLPRAIQGNLTDGKATTLEAAGSHLGNPTIRNNLLQRPFIQLVESKQEFLERSKRRTISEMENESIAAHNPVDFGFLEKEPIGHAVKVPGSGTRTVQAFVTEAPGSRAPFHVFPIKRRIDRARAHKLFQQILAK
jgi:hypothetical protein